MTERWLNKVVAERLTTLRLDRIMTQADMAHAAGMSQEQYWRYERGQMMSVPVLLKIVKAVGSTAGYLLDDIPPCPPGFDFDAWLRGVAQAQKFGIRRSRVEVALSAYLR